MKNIDQMTDEELKAALMTMSPEAAEGYQELDKSSAGLLASNLQEMEEEGSLIVLKNASFIFQQVEID